MTFVVAAGWVTGGGWVTGWATGGGCVAGGVTVVGCVTGGVTTVVGGVVVEVWGGVTVAG